MIDVNGTPYPIFLLVDLYNLYGDSWPKQIRNEVRHELRQYGYKIMMVDDNLQNTKAVHEDLE